MHHEVSLIATVCHGPGPRVRLRLRRHQAAAAALVGYLVAVSAWGPSRRGWLPMPGWPVSLPRSASFFHVRRRAAFFRRRPAGGALDRGSRRGGGIVLATAIGAAMAMAWGWSLGAGLVLGRSLSVASPWCCCARWRSDNAVDTVNGRIAVGWLIVEDLAMVLAFGAAAGCRRDAGGHFRPGPGRQSADHRGAHPRQGRAVRRHRAHDRTHGWCRGCWGRSPASARANSSTLSVLAIALGIA